MPSKEVAVVGMACRTAGAGSPAELWDRLASGTDCVTGVPWQRWALGCWANVDRDPSALGWIGQGGFLDDVDGFDRQFFGLSTGRAVRMDPQQRKLLEVTWECMESAGWRSDEIAAASTGVYVGVSTFDYSNYLFGRDTTDGLAPMTCLNMISAIVANQLDLKGPAVSVDSACSSGLSALLLAADALEAGTCDRAFVCGTNVLLDPRLSMTLRMGGMLSPDGKCRAFAEGAGGYVRSEAIAAVALRPLSDALAAGDRVLGIIRACAGNQDGATPSITSPSMQRQVEVIERALAVAGVDPAEVDYVECHGTGTAVGDVTEVAALHRAFDRSDGRHLRVGSIKSNIGHTEAASGLCGLIKVLLMFQHDQIPPTLHCSELNHRIDFVGQHIAPVQELTAWPGQAARVAGVNSFGFGGTNVHLVLEAPPAAERVDVSGPLVLPLSARSRESLRSLGAAWVTRLRTLTQADAYAATRTSTESREAHPIRRTYLARDREDLIDQLSDDLAGSAATAQPRQLVSMPDWSRPVFVFTGQGDVHAGMGAGLLEMVPAFAETVRRCAEVADEHGFDGLMTLLTGDGDAGATGNAQPLLFAYQAGVSDALRATGLGAAAVVGHSAGEVAASYACGAVSLADGMRLAIDRGRCLQDAEGRGGMVACSAPIAWLDQAVAGRELWLSAQNGPQGGVVSGAWPELEAFRELAAAASYGTAVVNERYPFHSPLVADCADRLVVELDRDGRSATAEFYSGVRGGRLDGELYDVEYWRSNVLDMVRFRTAVDTLLEDGYRAFVEIGPRATLVSAIRQAASLRGVADEVAALSSTPHGQDEVNELAAAAATVFDQGGPVRLGALLERADKSGLDWVPSYPWNESSTWVSGRDAFGAADRGFGSVLSSLDRNRTGSGAEFEVRYDADLQGDVWSNPFFDHVIGRQPILPAAAIVNLFVAAARDIGLGPDLTLEEMVLGRFIPLGAGPAKLRLTITRSAPDSAVAELSFARADCSNWQLAASIGRIITVEAPPLGRDGSDVPDGQQEARSATAEPDWPELRVAMRDLPIADFYGNQQYYGLNFGPAFQPLTVVQGNADAARGIAVARGRDGAPDVAGSREFEVDPRLLDGGLNLCLGVDREDGPIGVPTGITRITVRGRVQKEARVVTRVRGLAVDVMLLATEGTGSCVLTGVHGEPLRPDGESRDRGRAAAEQVTLEYDESWVGVAAPVAPVDSTFRRVVAASLGDHPAPVVAQLVAHGDEVVTVLQDRTLSWASRSTATCDMHDRASVTDVLDQCAGPAQRLDCVLVLADPLRAAAGEPNAAQLTADTCEQVVNWLVGATQRTAVRDVFLVTVGAFDEATPPLRRGVARALWSLGRAAQFELTGTRVGLVDLPAEPSPADWDTLANILDAGVQLGELRVVDGSIRRRQVVRRSPAGDAAYRPRPDGAYVLLGGTGGLGRQMARRLVELGARHVHLVGLSGANPFTEELSAWAATQDATVRVWRADCASWDALGACLQQVRAEGLPVVGVAHAAGVLGDTALPFVSGDLLRRVLAPKVGAFPDLVLATQGDPLDWLLTFSSAAAAVGSPGQSAYAAANGFLDGYAAALSGGRTRLVNIAWGPWAETGMAVAALDGETGFQGHGLGGVPIREGLDVLFRALGAGRPYTIAVPFELEQLGTQHPAVANRATYDGRPAGFASPTGAPQPVAPAPGVPAVSGPPTSPHSQPVPLRVDPASLSSAAAAAPDPESAPMRSVVAAEPAVPPPSADRPVGAPPGTVGSALGVASQSPGMSQTEAVVAAVWEGVFGIPDIGLEDGFDTLGGDSVMAFQVLTQLSQAAGVRIAAEDAFDDFTIRGLARLIDGFATPTLR